MVRHPGSTQVTLQRDRAAYLPDNVAYVQENNGPLSRRRAIWFSLVKHI